MKAALGGFRPKVIKMILLFLLHPPQKKLRGSNSNRHQAQNRLLLQSGAADSSALFMAEYNPESPLTLALREAIPLLLAEDRNNAGLEEAAVSRILSRQKRKKLRTNPSKPTSNGSLFLSLKHYNPFLFIYPILFFHILCFGNVKWFTCHANKASLNSDRESVVCYAPPAC